MFYARRYAGPMSKEALGAIGIVSIEKDTSGPFQSSRKKNSWDCKRGSQQVLLKGLALRRGQRLGIAWSWQRSKLLRMLGYIGKKQISQVVRGRS
jgi:hypothetical protein